VTGGIVMCMMIVLGVVLRFAQEARADSAAAKLKAMIHGTATVVRDGEAREVPLAELVPGGVIQLSAADMVPADVRLLAAKDLFRFQSALPGEDFPVEKFAEPDAAAAHWATWECRPALARAAGTRGRLGRVGRRIPGRRAGPDR
jgi:Mg2+-importing ATPase